MEPCSEDGLSVLLGLAGTPRERQEILRRNPSI